MTILPPYIQRAIEVAYLDFRKSDKSGQIKIRVDKGKIGRVWTKLDKCDIIWENKTKVERNTVLEMK